MGEASLQHRGRFEFQERVFLWNISPAGNLLMGHPFSLSCYSSPLGLRIGARAEATQVQLNTDPTLDRTLSGSQCAQNKHDACPMASLL